MKLKHLILGIVAAFIGGAALAQNVIPPLISGANTEHRREIFEGGIFRAARADTLTATASGTLANSAVLNLGMNVVATVTTTNDSFTLPTATGSIQVSIVNGGANTLKVWPNVSTGQIDTAGAGAGKTVAANKMAIFTQGADGLWYSVTSP